MRKLMKAIAAIMLTVAVVCAAGCNKQENNNVKVTTHAPQDITATTATISGEVDVMTSGISITEKGVCWGISRNPTVSDNHMASNGRGMTVTCTITGLEPGTMYHVRVYATDGTEFYYGTDQSFTTLESGGGGNDSHSWVDLGLPSGTLWATCNVGANTPEEYGDYFAWGETEPKDTYYWTNYKLCYGRYDQLTKYCSRSNYGFNGFTDTRTVLEPNNDAATVNWGNSWRMPFKEQWEELMDNTTSEWTIKNGVYGRVFYGNGQSLFLPAAGSHSDDNSSVGYGGYWSSSLYKSLPNNALYLGFGYWDYNESDYINMNQNARCVGQSVRAVRAN